MAETPIDITPPAEVTGESDDPAPVFVFSVKLPLLLTGHEAVKTTETRAKKGEPTELYELTFKAVVDKENLIAILRMAENHKIEAVLGGDRGT